jgi:hypothetical protein
MFFLIDFLILEKKKIFTIKKGNYLFKQDNKKRG